MVDFQDRNLWQQEIRKEGDGRRGGGGNLKRKRSVEEERIGTCLLRFVERDEEPLVRSRARLKILDDQVPCHAAGQVRAHQVESRGRNAWVRTTYRVLRGPRKVRIHFGQRW